MSNVSNCQTLSNSLDFVNFNGQVQLIDSQYFFIYRINVTNGKKIYVDKTVYFDQGDCPSTLAPGRFRLKRIVRNFPVNISIDATRHFDELENFGIKMEVSEKRPKVDSVLLDNLFPFEIGNYFLYAEIEVLYNNQKFIVAKDNMHFRVPYLPKNSLFND